MPGRVASAAAKTLGIAWGLTVGPFGLTLLEDMRHHEEHGHHFIEPAAKRVVLWVIAWGLFASGITLALTLAFYLLVYPFLHPPTPPRIIWGG